MEWKSNLGAFMQKHEHYSVKEINNIIINPLLENLIKEFSRYDDFLSESFKRKDKIKDIEINYLRVKPNCYPNYFRFEVQIWFEKGQVFIKNGSLDVLKKAAKIFSLEEEIEEHEEYEVFELSEAFKYDYLATIITRMFINYYEYTCRQNKFTSLEIQKSSLGC